MSISFDKLSKNRRFISAYALSWYLLTVFGVLAFTMIPDPLAIWFQLSFFLVLYPLILSPIFVAIETDKSSEKELPE